MMARPCAPTLLGLPVELRCDIYSHTIPGYQRDVHCLHSQKLNLSVNFEQQTIDRSHGGIVWQYYYVDSDRVGKSLRGAYPLSVPELVMSPDKWKLFDRLWPELRKVQSPGVQELQLKGVIPTILSLYRGTIPNLGKYFHMIPFDEPRSLLSTCSMIRLEFRDWLFSNCKFYLQRVEYGNVNIRASLQCKMLCPQLRQLEVTFDLTTEKPEVFADDLGALTDLKSLIIKLRAEPDDAFAMWIILQGKPCRYQLNCDWPSVARAFTRIAEQSTNLLQFRIQPAVEVIGRYYKTAKLQEELDDVIERRQKKEN